jgi:hypothetical protein
MKYHFASRKSVFGVPHRLLFESTVDGAVYRDLVQQFVAWLEVDERDCWFQQDGATCSTVDETINMLRDFLGYRLIFNNIWSLRSPDLMPPDFSIGSLEGKSLKR